MRISSAARSTAARCATALASLDSVAACFAAALAARAARPVDAVTRNCICHNDTAALPAAAAALNAAPSAVFAAAIAIRNAALDAAAAA